MTTFKKYTDALNALQEGKIYTFQEIQNEISAGPGSHILNDLIAVGRIVRTLHPVLNCTGYKLA